MSKLDEMIRELCPDGVEYVKLNSVCDIYDGTHSTPNYTESGVKFASVENIGNLYATRKYISEKDFEKYKIKPRIGDVMMTRIGSVGVCTVVDRNEALAFYVSLALLRPQLDKVQSRFLKYAIESIHGRKELRKRTLINAVPIKINKDDIGKVTIPLPPIEIQSEIVHTLDNYTENVVKLQNQLTAELTARKAQYSYYRDKLLTFESRIQLLPLKDIAKFSYGYTDKAQEHGDTRFLRITDIAEDGTMKPEGAKYILLNDESKKYLVKKGDLLLARTGATYGKTLYVPDNSPAVYSSFLQRGFDQMIHDVCLQKLPVVFAVDRAGLVGSDGETHQGIFDLSYLSMIPNMTVLSPKNKWELADMVRFAVRLGAPAAVRYPRGSAFDGFREYRAPIEYGKSEPVYEEEDIAIISVGHMFEQAVQVRKRLKEIGYNCTLINARFVKPVDEEMLRKLTVEHRLIVTLEENIRRGGFGEFVTAYLAGLETDAEVLNLALPDDYIEHGSVDLLRSEVMLDIESCVARIITAYIAEESRRD